jgi:DNA-binding transcriptional regulator LsrR (DeoR family)
MVEITIHNPGSIDLELSTELQRRFRLEHAYVVMTDDHAPDDRADAVAKATAELLQSILREEDVLGVDCGRTLNKVANHLTTLPPSDVVQLTGMAGELNANGADLVRRISEISGGKTWPMYAPLVVADARTAASLSGNHQIQETVARHAKVTCAIVSIGAWQPGASQVYQALTTDDADELTRAGVCGEACALLLDADGVRLPGLDERRVAVDEATLRAIPTVIAVAAGPQKIAATRAVLLSGLVSSIVTEAEIAAAVLA